MQYSRHTYSQTYLFTPCHHLVLLLVTGNQFVCYDCSLVSVVKNMSPSVVSFFSIVHDVSSTNGLGLRYLTYSFQMLSSPFVAENGLPNSKNHTFYDEDEDDKDTLLGMLYIYLTHNK